MNRCFAFAFVFGLVVLTGHAAHAQAVKIMAEGKVLGVAPGMIAMLTTNGKKYTIVIPEDKSVVSITGALTPAQFGPGMILRFTGALEGDRMTDEVKQITVYTKNDGYMIGILQADASPIPVITAVLSRMKDNTITVGIGRKQITATLAEDVAINVESGDYSAAPVGAAIQVDGRFVMKNKKPTAKITPKSVKIQLPEVVPPQ